MDVLVLCDDLWHPAEVIELGLKELEGDGFRFTVVKAAKDILTEEMIAGYPVILCCKGNGVTAANTAPWFEDGVTEVGPAEFEAYVRRGGGFVALHSTNTAQQDGPWADFLGNRFLGHPPRCRVDAHVTAAHPVTRGVHDFSVRDEHYQVTVTAPDAAILLKTRSDMGGEQVGGYTREMGDGRLCVLTPGHTLGVWQNVEFQKLVKNAIRWCAKA